MSRLKRVILWLVVYFGSVIILTVLGFMVGVIIIGQGSEKVGDALLGGYLSFLGALLLGLPISATISKAIKKRETSAN